MQLHKQYKHVWFVFLMIFFIGGSGVAVAAVQEVRLDQKTSIVQTMPCHDQQMMDQHHQMQMLCKMRVDRKYLFYKPVL